MRPGLEETDRGRGRLTSAAARCMIATMGKRKKPVPVIPYTVRLTEAAHERLGRLAVESGLSKNAVLNAAIELLDETLAPKPRNETGTGDE